MSSTRIRSRRGSGEYELGAFSRRAERRRSPRLLALHIESDLTKQPRPSWKPPRRSRLLDPRRPEIQLRL